MRTVVVSLLLAVTLVGCGERSSSERGGRNVIGPDGSIAILGDRTREGFRDALGKEGVSATCPTNSSVEARARLLASCDAAVVVVDATQGPLPIHREDILITKHFFGGTITIGFSRTDMVDDPELLELEELEMREIMNDYDLDGDNAPAFFDSPKARTAMPKGFSAIKKGLHRLPRKPARQPGTATTAFQAFLYVLANEETFARNVARPLSQGKYRVVFGSATATATIAPASSIAPGSSGHCLVTLDSAVELTDGEKFVISESGHVSAAGSITKRQQTGASDPSGTGDPKR